MESIENLAKSIEHYYDIRGFNKNEAIYIAEIIEEVNSWRQGSRITTPITNKGELKEALKDFLRIKEQNE
ncbi:MAG: hypothetical protein U9N59_01215 [Campylobacterota bacterium]|nr:hypothetical protein [Campylobacterota bacterium]